MLVYASFLRLGVYPLDVVGYGLYRLFVRRRGFPLGCEDRRRFRSVYSPFLGYLGPVRVFGESVTDCRLPPFLAVFPDQLPDFDCDSESWPAVWAPGGAVSSL